MDAYDFWRSLRDCLEVKANFVDGSLPIEVGERFMMQVRVRNCSTAPNSTGSDVPAVVFRNISISVEGTQYARPVTNTAHVFPGPLLPGVQEIYPVALEAIGHMAEHVNPSLEEPVARVTVSADLDQDEFFAVGRKQVFRVEIEP
jgi:hypothetical protein